MHKTSNISSVPKQFIEVPLPISCSGLYHVWVQLKGFMLSPFYLVMARITGAPGIGFHLRCTAMSIRLLLSRRASPGLCCHYILFPMDSTRYFEFHEVWKSLTGLSVSRYLDVSSPRLLPLLFLKASLKTDAVLINPDLRDLQDTEQLATALGLKPRCVFFNGTLDSAEAVPASFDLITCISVLEHIPDDKVALETMWSLLRPSGKLILTLPCMAQPLDQYISHNQYGVLNPGDDGYTFWQRYYDNDRLRSSIYSVTGMPARIVIYGEKKRGLFFRNAAMKRLLGTLYPFWREPYMMAAEYQLFSSIDDLPGEGVVMLEFVKPGEPI